MTVSLAYDATLSRVRVSYSGAPADANTVHVERSTDQITWTTVRGGARAALASGSATVDDYEFAANVVNYYRATPLQFEDFEVLPLAITTSGSWARDTERSHNGQWSLRSADRGPNGLSEELIAAPGDTGSFWYSVSSEQSFDKLHVIVENFNDLSNSGFESGIPPWTATNATVAQSSAQVHSGSFSAEVTPDGTGTVAWISSEQISVIPQDDVVAAGWFYLTTAGDAACSVDWFDSTGAVISTSSNVQTLSAGVWTQLLQRFAAPAGAASAVLTGAITGSPTTSDVFYIDDAILRIERPVFSASGNVDWTRSPEIDVSTWDNIRLRYSKDGTVTVGLDAAFVDDMRFQFTTEGPAQITPSLDTVWLKFIARPFLNQPVTVIDWSDVQRPARNGVFQVLGRSVPIAVTSPRGSRRYTLTVMEPTPDDAESFDYVLASGDPVFVHVPPDCGLPRSMYAVIGDTSQSRKTIRSPRRYFELPLTEVAAPAPEIVGATVTWSDVVASFATWADVVAAVPTWGDLTELVADPSTVVVP